MNHTKVGNQMTKIVHPVDAKIAPFFSEKLPSLPENIREILAKITPFVTILGVVLGTFAIFAILGLTAVASPMVMMYGGMGGTQALAGGVIGLLFLAIQIILQGFAIPGLFKRQRSAWNLLFVAGLVSAIFDLVTLNLFNLVVSFLITFYLLYQIRPYYNK